MAAERDAFVYGRDDLPIEQINKSAGAVTCLHHDQAGSTRLLTGSTGSATGKCCSPYGTPTAKAPLGFDGQYTSGDTGLIYMRHRVYDPTASQFLGVDPAVASTEEPLTARAMIRSTRATLSDCRGRSV
jgi:RHS repeat-associated protein